MKGIRLGLILKVIPVKLFLDHFRFRKSQRGLDIANPVTRTLVTWTTQTVLHAFSSPTKHPCDTRVSNIHCMYPKKVYIVGGRGVV